MDIHTSSYFLPNKFKKIGIGLIIAHLTLIFVLALTAEYIFESFTDPVFYWLVPLFRYSLMIGLVMYISAKEQFEDEMIRQIRLKSFQYGLYLTVFVSISLFVVSLGSNTDLRLMGVDGINAMLIYISAIYKFNLYRFKTDQEK